MTKGHTCAVRYMDKDAVRAARSRMPDSRTIMKMADSFKILGDPTRLKMLHALSKKELCVCDLAALLGMAHSAVSHQLRLLRGMNIVRFRKHGKVVYYSLADRHVMKLLGMCIRHAKE